MNISKSEILLEKLDGIIHEPTQKQDKHIDLTVKEITKVNSKGKLDFGGGEFQPSETKKINPEKKNREDDYGWWNLDKGIYLVKYNENITNSSIFIQPHKRLIKTGCYTINRIIYEKGEILDLLVVGKNGVDIKENARIAVAFDIQ